MKKTKFLLVLLTVLLVCGLCSCANQSKEAKSKNQMIFGQDLLDANVIIPSEYQEMKLSIPFACTEKGKQKMSLKKVEGDNISTDEIEVDDFTNDEFRDVNYKGYYLNILGMTITLRERKPFTIHSITVEVSGQEKKLDFAKDLSFDFAEENNDFDCYASADVILADSQYDLAYKLKANTDIKKLSYSITDPYSIEEIRFMMDKNNDESELKNIKKGDSFVADLNISLPGDKKHIWCRNNVVVNYVTKDNKKKTYYFLLMKQGVGEEEDVEEVLKKIVQ